jgi:hypothetical protein
VSNYVLANDGGDFVTDGLGNRVVVTATVLFDPAGVAGAEAFGSPITVAVTDLSGIPSAEAFGSAITEALIAAAGLASAEAFGTFDYSVGGVDVSPPGIASAEAFGTSVAGVTYDVAAASSNEAFGSPTFTRVPVFNTAGIPSGEAFGRPLARGGVEQFLGVLDDFRLFGGALPTDAEVEDAAMRELGPSDPSPVTYHKFEAGTGTTSFPESGPHQGTLSGTVRWVGFEGGADVRGQRKPRVWGVKRQQPGVWVDHQRLVVQLNDGPTQAIAPYDRALSSLAYAGDFANVYDWTSVAGYYATQLSKGLLRFHEEPLGKMSFDVWGDKTGGTYVEKPLDVVQRLLTVEGGVDLLSGIDLAALFAASEARQDAVGLATGTDPMTLPQGLDKVVSTIDGVWFFERGLFSLWLRQEPSEVPDYELDENDVVVEAIRRTPGRAVTKSWRLRFKEFAVTSELHEIAGSVPAADRPMFTQQWRSVATPTNEEVGRRHLDARVAEDDTLYDDEGAAWAESGRRQVLDRKPRDLYDVPLRSGVFRYRIGKTVRLKVGRFKFPEEGRLLVIGGYDEDAATGAVTLYLWG